VKKDEGSGYGKAAYSRDVQAYKPAPAAAYNAPAYNKQAPAAAYNAPAYNKPTPAATYNAPAYGKQEPAAYNAPTYGPPANNDSQQYEAPSY